MSDNRDEWAQRTARHIVGGALSATEPLPQADRDALLREIAKQSLWHMPDSREEVGKLKNWLEIENLRQPHPGDKPPKR